MKRKIFALFAAVSAFALVLSGCGNGEEATAEVSETTEETTSENPYLLVRGWTGKELLESVFFCGENRPLPLSLEECPDFVLMDGNLVFPDGSFAEASLNDDGLVTALRFKWASAPDDFSVWGVGFDALPYSIPDTVGIADSVYGDEDTVLTYSFYGGGITELTFIFNEKELSEVYIAS